MYPQNHRFSEGVFDILEVKTKKIIVFTIFQLILGVVLSFINHRYLINSPSDIQLEQDFSDSWQLFIMLTYILVIVPKYWFLFKKLFISKDLFKAIMHPIIIALFLYYILSIIQYLPVTFGMSSIPVGRGQSTSSYIPLSLVDFIYMGFFPAFNEELLFRFFPYAWLYLFVTNGRSRRLGIFSKLKGQIKHLLFVTRDKRLEWIWIFFFSTLFAIIHEPNVFNFYMYFIPGAVFNYMFLRYGFISGVIAHATFNFMRVVMTGAAIGTLKLFFPI